MSGSLGRRAGRSAPPGAAGRVALEETGAVLGAMLRRALVDRLAAQAVRRVEASGPEAWRAGDDGGDIGADDHGLGDRGLDPDGGVGWRDGGVRG